MRITTRMTSNMVINNLKQNLERLQSMQNQMSSGKKVSKPSDDPIKTSQILSLKTTLSNEQFYQSNMDEAVGIMDSSENALNNVTNVLQRVRELIISGASSTLSQTDREALGAEVDQLVDELVQSTNTSFSGQYLFGGQLTTDPPFQRSTYSYEVTDEDGQLQTVTKEAVVYLGNDGDLEWEVGQGVTTAININGQDCFQVATDENINKPVSKIFEVLFATKEALNEGDVNKLSGECLQQLDESSSHILNMRATLGAKSNRLNIAKDRSFDAQIKMQNLLSKLEDIDLEKIVMEYKMQEYVYQAALATTAQIIQPSLLNFLS